MAAPFVGREAEVSAIALIADAVIRSMIGAAAKPDTSYNQVEKSRGTAFSAADTSYNQVEKSRARATGQ